jgi:hypothetical protein
MMGPPEGGRYMDVVSGFSRTDNYSSKNRMTDSAYIMRPGRLVEHQFSDSMRDGRGGAEAAQRAV